MGSFWRPVAIALAVALVAALWWRQATLRELELACGTYVRLRENSVLVVPREAEEQASVKDLDRRCRRWGTM